MAYLTLHHRGAVPEVDNDSILRSGDDAAKLRMLLAFLRAADAMDSRWMTSPALSISLKGRRLRINCRLREDHPKAAEVFSRRKKFRLLEELLGCKVEVAIESNRRLRLVA